MNRRVVFASLAAVVLAAGLAGAPIPSAFAAPPEASVVRSDADPCFWQTVKWVDMSEAEQALWTVLGWTPDVWESTDENDYPDSEFKTFDQLSPVERDAVKALGYTQETWDHIDDYCGSTSN